MNWERSQLKQMARTALQGSYWKSVFAAFLISLTTATYSSSGAMSFKEETSEITSNLMPYLPIFISAIFFGVSLGLALRILVMLPLEVGCRRYFLEDIYYPTELDRLKAGFAVNYWNVVWVQFLRGLFTTLWTLLFIVPGIVKAYEYRMIPYLLAEDPNMSSKEAFAISKRMMDGEKMNAFVLDLSFFGWMFLSAITLGIVGIFYYQPYHELTSAALYHALKEKIGGYDGYDGYYDNSGYDNGGYGDGYTEGYGSTGGQGGYDNGGNYYDQVKNGEPWVKNNNPWASDERSDNPWDESNGNRN